MLNNHVGISRSSANKMTNFQEQSKPSNNQINAIQSSPLNNSNNHDNISSDNSEIQSLNNTLSATMDEKQKTLLLKIANNSIAAASAVASAADNDYGNVSVRRSFIHSFCDILLSFPLSQFTNKWPIFSTIAWVVAQRKFNISFNLLFHSQSSRIQPVPACWARRHPPDDVAHPLCLMNLLYYTHRQRSPSRKVTKMLCRWKKWHRLVKAYGKWVEYFIPVNFIAFE